MKIVVDLEATCSDVGEIPRDEEEMIEIGACAVNQSHEVIDEFQRFIRPQRHPVLTDFCVSLTSITQAQVDAACSFTEVLGEFQAWIGAFIQPVFCSWGNYDKNQLRKECALHSLAYPFGEEHINLKKAYAKAVDAKPMGLGLALGREGIEFAGTHHRGIADARNMVRLFPVIFSKPEMDTEEF